jgi:S1-C subfamily serine protease
VPFDPSSDDEDSPFGAPLPADDRLWRHPSEVGGLIHAARRRREVSTIRILALTVAGGLLGSVITVGALAAGGAFSRRSVIEQAGPVTVAVTQPTPTTALSGEGTRWTEIVQRFEPSLARLESAGGNGQVDGTAVALRVKGPDTFFVTSEDLVRGVPDVTLVLANGRRRKATVVGTDQYTNLAVIKVTDEVLAVPDLEATTEPQTATDALVVGAAPRQAESPSVAKALVSAVNHQQLSAMGTVVQGLLQTDANLTPESKGGALVDADGRLLGIIALMARDETGTERFGYALPIKVVVDTADSLIETGFPTQVWLGVQGVDLPYDEGQSLGLPGGALINAVVPNSPAQACNLQPTDVVVQLNNLEVPTMSALVMGLRALEPNDTVTITYARQGRIQICLTTLTRPPAPGSPVTGELGGPVPGTPSTTAPGEAGTAPGAATTPTSAPAAPGTTAGS